MTRTLSLTPLGGTATLADTDLFIEVTEDRCRGPRGGDEVVFGGGKVIRESMGSPGRPAPTAPPTCGRVHRVGGDG